MKYYIYKIYNENCDYIYVGSTKAYRERKRRHKECCYNEKSGGYHYKIYQTIRDNGGWENWKMVCIEEINVENKRQAEMKEEEWRLQLQAKLNARKAYGAENKKEYLKQYYEQNKEIRSQKMKEYRENNKELMLQKKKEYREKNKEQINEKQRQKWHENKEKRMDEHKKYVENNKDKVKEYHKQYYQNNKEKNQQQVTCECGSTVTILGLTKHKKTKKHLEFVSQK